MICPHCKKKIEEDKNLVMERLFDEIIRTPDIGYALHVWVQKNYKTGVMHI